MARVTVEDCIVKIPNRFELVMVAGRRAKDLASGATPTIDRGRDKNPVVALREIAQATVPTEALEEALIRSHQKSIAHEEAEQEIVDLMKGEQAWTDAAAAEAAERMAATGGMEGFDTPEETDDSLEEGADDEEAIDTATPEDKVEE